MASIAQIVPTEVTTDFAFPQREAAFFYGLFLRGHSPEQLRRDIEVLQISGKGYRKDFVIYDEADQQNVVKAAMRRLRIKRKTPTGMHASAKATASESRNISEST